MTVSRVAVLGAGNGGCAAAADLTLRGFTVSLFTRSQERIAAIRENGGITLQGVAGEGLVPIARVTNDLAAAVSDAEVIVVTVPTSAFPYYAPLLVPLVKPDQVVVLNPGHMGGSLFFAAEAKRSQGHSDLQICETITLTYACRMQGPATVKIFGVSSNLLFAAFPGNRVDALFAKVAPLFPNIRKARNVLETGLMDLNAVEHPPQILLNAGWVEHSKGDFYFYYEGTTPAVARAIEAVDVERIAVCKAAGVPTKSFVQYFCEAGYTTPEGAANGSVYEAMQASAPNRWIKSPPSLDHRYVHEDVGWGLVPYAELGGVLGVPTPTIDALITLACTMNGIDYRSEGLTLARIGLAGLDPQGLERFIMEGSR